MTHTIDFIGIGTSKSATTTVARLLDAHPQICLSVPKEVVFFNNPEHFDQNQVSDDSLNWYLKHFNHCSKDSLKGEFTPRYFAHPDVPKNIHQNFPNAKLILCLRNPTDRAYSQYQMMKNRRLKEKLPFNQAIYNNPIYLNYSLYFKHLNKYLEYFDMNQIIILTFKEIKTEPIKSIQKVYRFLGANDKFVPENSLLKANSSVQIKSKLLRDIEFYFVSIMGRIGAGNIVKWLKSKNVHLLIQKLYSKPYKYPSISSEDKKRLQEYFLNDIEQLEHLLQRDFSGWK